MPGFDLGSLTGIAGQVLPILKMLGLDPTKMIGKLERGALTPKLEHGIPAVVMRLEHDGMTPAVKDVDAAGERVFIRAALYLVLKEGVKSFLPQGANLVADTLRDAVDEKVVALVGPQMDATTSTEAAVRLVVAAYVDQVF